MSRTRLVLALGLLAAVAYHCRSGSAPPPPAAIQAAVLADGFAVKRGARVFELDTSGKLRTEHALDVDGDVRVIGSSIGPLAGYQNGTKLDLVRVRDGKTESSWGKSVRKLCDGVATNDANFAIGWLESDNRVWIVYGPTTSDQVLASASTARLDWCGVASAGSNIGLFWRERDKLQWQLCSRKGCSGLPSRYDLVKDSPVLGIGCLADGCAIASADKSGATQLAYVTTKSKVVWTVKLPAYAGMPVSIVGTPNALVVGYANEGGAAAVRYDRAGTAIPVWSGDAAPALAWSNGRLLVSTAYGSGVRNETITLSGLGE